MNSVLGAVLVSVLSLQSMSAQSFAPLAFNGQWSNTSKGRGLTAPMFPAALAIETKDGKTSVSIGNQPAVQATVYRLRSAASADDQYLLAIKYPPTPASSRIVIIRSLDAKQIRVESYIESLNGGNSRYDEEIFARAEGR